MELAEFLGQAYVTEVVRGEESFDGLHERHSYSIIFEVLTEDYYQFVDKG